MINAKCPYVGHGLRVRRRRTRSSLTTYYSLSYVETTYYQMTERDWYVSYDKTLFGRENGRYIKEQSEPLVNCSSLRSLRMLIIVYHSPSHTNIFSIRLFGRRHSYVFYYYPHLSLQTSESPCCKGLEGSERSFYPLTALSLPLSLGIF